MRHTAVRSTWRPSALATGLAGATLAGILAGIVPAPAAGATLPLPAARPALLAPSRLSASGALRQCLAGEAQQERSATFVGEMTTVPGAAKMELRIDVLERAPGETTYHTVSAPGLGAWWVSAAGVKTYKHLEQVTNLAGPAFYRAVVYFRWVNAKGRLIATTERRTRRCEQPGPAGSEEGASTTGGPSPATPPPAAPAS